MNSPAIKSRRVAALAVFCMFVGMTMTSGAQAQFFGILGGFLCGEPNTTPSPIHVTDSAGLRILTASTTTTVLTEKENNLRKLQHRVMLTSRDPSSKVLWTRNFFVKSRGVAQVFMGIPGWQWGHFFDLDNRDASPVFLFNQECLGMGLAKSGGKKYITVALGTQSAKGTPASGEDLTLINIYVLNKDTGNIVKIFRPRPQKGRYFLAFDSGIFDIDNDGNDELVLTSVKFSGGPIRYDFVMEYYNLITGVKENTIRTNQINDLVIK